MPKRKPDNVVVHRIELQERERELLELFLLSKTTTNIGDAIIPPLMGFLSTLTDPVRLYGFLTILETAGLLDTPVPTLGDMTDETGQAITALKDWLGLETAYIENAEVNTEIAENLSIQATEAANEKERIARDTGQLYREGGASYEDMMEAQREYNRAQGEAFKANLIAQSWEYYFYFELSGMQFDEEGKQVPNTGRMPNRGEIAQAKRDGVYYPAPDAATQAAKGGFVRGFLSNIIGPAAFRL